MDFREALAKGSMVALLLHFDFDDTTGELNKIRLLGIPVFDRRRWNARQERKRAKQKPPPATIRK